jgi:iron complex outermembrane receptor protein
LNICQTGWDAALIPQVQREGVLFSGHYQIAEAVDLFSEILTSHEQMQSQYGPFINATGATLSATNPYNPFGTPVGVSFAYSGPQSSFDASGSLIRPLLGIRGSLPSDWHYEVTTYFSRDRYQAALPLTNTAAIQGALSSSDPATAVNPFSSTTPGPTQLLQSIVNASTVLQSDYDDHIIDAQGILRGPLFHAPAGPLETVLGIEFLRENQQSEVLLGGANGATPLNLSRDSYATFGEGRVPLVARPGHPEGAEWLTLTVAGRYDHSNDFGGKATWQGGLIWRPTETISVNGSYGISYKAPTLSEIGGGVSFTYPCTNCLTDPFRGGEPVNANIIFGSNPNLKPETGNTRTLGVVYSSALGNGLRASLTYFDINISNYIAQPDFSTIVDNPNFYPGAVLRGPTTPQDQQLGFLGPITQVNDLYYNFGDLKVAGLDADVRYAMDSRWGQFAPSVAISNIYRWQSALVPGAPFMNGVSQAIGFSGVGFAPRWKATAVLGWKQGPLSASLTGRYTSEYKDYQDFVPNSNELGNFWIFDLNARYDAGKALASNGTWLVGTYLSVGAINLLDKTPPYSYFVGAPYDPTQYDIRGRIIYVQLGDRW